MQKLESGLLCTSSLESTLSDLDGLPPLQEVGVGDSQLEDQRGVHFATDPLEAKLEI